MATKYEWRARARTGHQFITKKDKRRGNQISIGEEIITTEFRFREVGGRRWTKFHLTNVTPADATKDGAKLVAAYLAAVDRRRSA